jgi:pyruvate/2-oxoglutarate dehydrogenase complex dihydrolipoamide dehydrogenase (E3) component/uncharacterized membrane protein YdjX (TVP38/TMEM64 family)
MAFGVLLFFALDLQRFFSLEALKAQYGDLVSFRSGQPWAAAGLYAFIYILVTGLSLPGAAVLTLAGGAVFGLFWGTVIVSFASTIGATLAFLLARFLFRDWVKNRFPRQFAAVDAGIARDGAFYLLALRLVPAVPFFLVNLLVPLTALPARTFFWVSQVGMLPGTLVYVNAGTQLGQVDSLSGILSPGLLLSFTLLGIFPLLARRLLDLLQARRAYARWPKPKRFDRNLVVIGAGAAGLVAASTAVSLRAKVTLVEQGAMGGDCLNTGCVPSKAMIRSARVLSLTRRAAEFGLEPVDPRADFGKVMDRVRQVIGEIAPHDSVERYTGLGVEVLQGRARLVSPWEVAIASESGERRLTTRSLVIATGARPKVPEIPGLAAIQYLTSESVWNLQVRPERLVVLGGGPVGCELAQCFVRLGSRVTLVEALPQLLGREDADVADMLAQALRADGVDLRLGQRAVAVEAADKVLAIEGEGQQSRLPFDALLLALGREPRLAGLGLEELGLELDASALCDERLQTRFPNIYVCGDAAGSFQFTHVAGHQAWHAAFNALLGDWWKLRVDYGLIPWATFCDPEVARVGLNEREARSKGIACEVTRLPMAEVDRAVAEGENQGFIKVLTPPGSDRILGASIVGPHAGDLITEFTLAMRHGLGLRKLLATIHVYPSYAGAVQQVAAQWRRDHAPRLALRWLEHYLQRRLG